MQIISQIRVTIRYRICEKYWVIIILESMCETQRIILFAPGVIWVLFNAILVVSNIVTSLVPRYFLLIGFALRVDWHFHSIIKQTIGFRIIQDVESYFLIFFCVQTSEVKPLGVTASIYIVLHQQIILWVGQFLRQV